MKRLRITIGKKSYDVTVEVLGEEAPENTPPRTSPAAPSPANSAPAESAPAAAPKRTPPPAAGNEPAPDGAVVSPLAGVVVSVLVRAGEEVQKGQELVILEAMKMENRITAPFAASVGTVNVSQGDSVTEGHLLLVLE
jgi:biotin carboxyl carrier protein